MKAFFEIVGIKDRNITSHIYEENEAKRIYQKILELYVDEFKNLEGARLNKIDA